MSSRVVKVSNWVIGADNWFLENCGDGAGSSVAMGLLLSCIKFWMPLDLQDVCVLCTTLRKPNFNEGKYKIHLFENKKYWGFYTFPNTLFTSRGRFLTLHVNFARLLYNLVVSTVPPCGYHMLKQL